MKEFISDDELLENTLAEQIPEVLPSHETAESGVNNATEEEAAEEQGPINPASQYIGQKLNHMPGESPFVNKEADRKMVEENKLSKIGQKIGENMEIRDGWIDVPRALLGERAVFYPEDWQFKIRPATVEAIRNWSTIDEESYLSMDDVFTEVIKSCLSIRTSEGLIPCTNICSWDRFFFLLLIREYTFVNGESKLEYEDDCIECGNPITFKLTSQSLMFELPDPEVMQMYDQATRSWHIDPREYDVEADPVTLYIPTLEKESNVKQWLIARQQENRNRKIDQVFLKFVAWLAPKISKDQTIANRQIREIERTYKEWDIDMFGFMDEVIKNVIVSPETSLTQRCPICGEEVTSPIRFPGKISDLFNVSNRRKKFGKK